MNNAYRGFTPAWFTITIGELVFSIRLSGGHLCKSTASSPRLSAATVLENIITSTALAAVQPVSQYTRCMAFANAAPQALASCPIVSRTFLMLSPAKASASLPLSLYSSTCYFFVSSPSCPSFALLFGLNKSTRQSTTRPILSISLPCLWPRPL